MEKNEFYYELPGHRFMNGDVAADLRIFCTTIGRPARDHDGQVVNAILLIHNTSGSSGNWLIPAMADELFNAHQPLDASKYYLIIPDSIGFGKSSKPSDGLRSKFPRYRYADAIRIQHKLVTEKLGITRLRMIVGLSMGGMHAWSWAEIYPRFAEAIVPIAYLPAPLSGRNWLQRRIVIESIRNDPDWNGGDYDSNPRHFMYTAPVSALMTQSIRRLQELAPTREDADAL